MARLSAVVGLLLLAVPCCYSGLGLVAETPGLRQKPTASSLLFAPLQTPSLRPAPHAQAGLGWGRICGPRLGANSLFGAQLKSNSCQLRLRREGSKTAVTCLLGDLDGFGDEFWDKDEVEDFLNQKLVLLRDEQVDRVIQCIVDREMEVDGKQYATLMPVDTPVIIAGFKDVNGTNELVPILEDSSIDALFPTASAVLAEMDLALSRSAVVLTVEGADTDTEDSEDFEDSDEDSDDMGEGLVLLGGDEDSEDDDDDDGRILMNLMPTERSTRTLTVGLRREELVDPDSKEEDEFSGEGKWVREGEDDDDFSGEDGEDQKGSEKIQVLATFYHEGDKYVVGAPLEPVLIIGSPVEAKSEESRKEVTVGDNIALFGLGINPADMAALDGGADYLLPAKEELERVTPQIEEQLESLWDEEEKEKEGLVQLRQKLIDQWKTDK